MYFVEVLTRVLEKFMTRPVIEVISGVGERRPSRQSL